MEAVEDSGLRVCSPIIWMFVQPCEDSARIDETKAKAGVSFHVVLVVDIQSRRVVCHCVDGKVRAWQTQ